MDTAPNMFVIINPNPARIKGSIGAIPRVDNFEFMADYNSMETFGRPSGTQHLYLLNDSSIDVNLKIFSIFKDFDPVVLKNMRVSLENYKIEANTEITGVVDGVELPFRLNSTQYKTIGDILSTVNVLVNNKTIDGKTNLKNLVNVLTELKDKETDLTGITTLLDTISSKLDNTGSGAVQKENVTFLNDTDFVTFTTSKALTLHFDYIYVDGGDSYIIYTYAGEQERVFTMKAGEVHRDIEIEMKANSSIHFNGTDPMFRAKYYTY